MGYLQHECAEQGTIELLRVMLPLIPEVDYAALYAECYRSMLATIEAYQMMKHRIESRLSPMN